MGFDDGSRDLPLSDPKIEIVSPRPAFGSYEETMNITRSFNPIMAAKKFILNSSFSVSGGNQLKRNGKNYGLMVLSLTETTVLFLKIVFKIRSKKIQINRLTNL